MDRNVLCWQHIRTIFFLTKTYPFGFPCQCNLFPAVRRDCGEHLAKRQGLTLWWPFRWRHNERDSVSNHQPDDCLLNRLFTRRSKKTSKLRVSSLCAGNSPETGEFPAQRASNAENGSIWWRHHAKCNVQLLRYQGRTMWMFVRIEAPWLEIVMIHPGSYHLYKRDDDYRTTLMEMFLFQVAPVQKWRPVWSSRQGRHGKLKRCKLSRHSLHHYCPNSCFDNSLIGIWALPLEYSTLSNKRWSCWFLIFSSRTVIGGIFCVPQRSLLDYLKNSSASNLSFPRFSR